MVLYPNTLPYTAPLGVLICGRFDGRAVGTLSTTCISTQPGCGQAPTLGPIERMPSRRVHALHGWSSPDGNLSHSQMAVNTGVAGFRSWRCPETSNASPLLNPAKPVNSAHEYYGQHHCVAPPVSPEGHHSPLMGRVLVSGSDPSRTVTPPQLENLARRIPVLGSLHSTISAVWSRPPDLHDHKQGLELWSDRCVHRDLWRNGKNLKVSLLGSTISTHGKLDGPKKQSSPDSHATANACTITAPPDAHTSPPGWFMMFILNGPTPSVLVYSSRIGGDSLHN